MKNAEMETNMTPLNDFDQSARGYTAHLGAFRGAVGAWAEQLIAESTGKEGTGILPEDASIPDSAGSPDSSISFGVLKETQALGDRRALLDAGRKVIRFYMEGDIPEGLERLAEAL